MCSLNIAGVLRCNISLVGLLFWFYVTPRRSSHPDGRITTAAASLLAQLVRRSNLQLWTQWSAGIIWHSTTLRPNVLHKLSHHAKWSLRLRF